MQPATAPMSCAVAMVLGLAPTLGGGFGVQGLAFRVSGLGFRV